MLLKIVWVQKQVELRPIARPSCC